MCICPTFSREIRFGSWTTSWFRVGNWDFISVVHFVRLISGYVWFRLSSLDVIFIFLPLIFLFFFCLWLKLVYYSLISYSNSKPNFDPNRFKPEGNRPLFGFVWYVTTTLKKKKTDLMMIWTHPYILSFIFVKIYTLKSHLLPRINYNYSIFLLRFLYLFETDRICLFSLYFL